METKNSKRLWAKLDTCNVAYRQWGTKGKPIVLLHGIPMNSSLWKQVGPELSASGYLVYAPEMLGLGYTEGPIDYDHSLNGQARLIGQFVNQVVRDEYILVGHDLGGGVAQIVATELSTKVRKCVFTNCVAFDSWPIDGIKLLIGASYKESYARLFTPKFVLNFLKRGLSAGLNDASLITNELLDDLCGGLVGTKERMEHFASFLRSMDNKYTQEASPRLDTFRQPTLVIWAKGDKFQPVPIGERLRDVLPDATWKLIEGEHFHPLESTILSEAIYNWDNSINKNRKRSFN
ncbi:MAG: alpha/beta hydrolase [Calditrichaeota bacterium]|nr:alpha/beta hydrolase [Calditrichota bacterium]